MKIVVMTNAGEVTAAFRSAEQMDYIDYSAELDHAISEAIRREGRRLPSWLRARDLAN